MKKEKMRINYLVCCIIILTIIVSLHCKEKQKTDIIKAQKKYESTISHPINAKYTTDNLLNNLIPGRKYKINENVELLKKIIVAKWDAFDWGVLEIQNNGVTILTNFDHYNNKIFYEYGTWELNRQFLLLRKNNKSKISKCEIDHFILKEFDEKSSLKKSGYNYYIWIIFTKETQTKEGIYEFYMQF